MIKNQELTDDDSFLSDFEGSSLTSVSSCDVASTDHSTMDAELQSQPTTIATTTFIEEEEGVQNDSSPSSQLTKLSESKTKVFEGDKAMFTPSGSSTDLVSDWGSQKEDNNMDIDNDVTQTTKVTLTKSTMLRKSRSRSNTNSTDSTLTSISSDNDAMSSTTLPTNANINSKSKSKSKLISKRLNLKTNLDLANPNIRDRAGRSQLFRYAENGDLESCKKLIAVNANVNLTDNAGWYPLHLACSGGYSEIVELLLQNGADINARGSNIRKTPLHDAAETGDKETIRILLKHGADPFARNSSGQSVLDSCTQPECIKLLKLRMDQAKAINEINDIGQSKLYIACSKESVKVVHELLKLGADVNAVDSISYSPLHCSVKRGNLEIISALLKHGALPNQKDKDGNTPLHLACTLNRLQVVELLLKGGASPLYRNSLNQLPYELTMNESITEVVRDHIITSSTGVMDMDNLLPRPISKSSTLQPDISSSSSKSLPEPSLSFTPKSPFGSSRRSARKMSVNTIDSEPSVSDNHLGLMKRQSKSLKRKENGPTSAHKRSNTKESGTSTKLTNGKNGIRDDDEEVNVLSSPYPTEVTLSTLNPIPDFTQLEGDLPLEFQNLIKKALGYSPIYCVKLLEHSDCNHGFLALDFQIQHFLQLPDRPGILFQLYPGLTKFPLTQQHKDRMWPAMRNLLKLNCELPSARKPTQYKQFVGRELYFVRYKDLLRILKRDYPPFYQIIEKVAFDINYTTSMSDPGPGLHLDNNPSQDGTAGFLPKESDLHPEVTTPPATDATELGPTPLITHQPLLPQTNSRAEERCRRIQIHRQRLLQLTEKLGYVGPPKFVRNVKKFLIKAPQFNPRPDLPLDEAVKVFLRKPNSNSAPTSVHFGNLNRFPI